MQVDSKEYMTFIRSLKIGDEIAVVAPASYTKDVITKVTLVDVDYIQVEKYPRMVFKRTTGREYAEYGGTTCNRYLYCPVAIRRSQAHEEYKENLMSLIKCTDVLITHEIYKKCCEVLKPILGD